LCDSLRLNEIFFVQTKFRAAKSVTWHPNEMHAKFLNCTHSVVSTKSVQRKVAVLARDAPLEVSCFRGSLPLPHSWDFLLPLPASNKVGRFRVRFRFQLILSERFRFLQNFTASSFRRFLSNCMLQLPSTKLKT